MSRQWIVILTLLIVALPSALYAIGMGGMGGMGEMGGMVDKIYLQTKDVGKVVFSHNLHGTRCNECHPKLFEKKSSRKFITMSAMERGVSCGACHNGKKAFSVKGDCARCHGNGDIIYETDAGKATFSHDVHTGAFGCDACHSGTFKAQKGANKASMAEMEKGASCGACHDGSTAFSVKDEDTCGTCHEM
jgi:c(7)-type cytochrome triheme protein